MMSFPWKRRKYGNKKAELDGYKFDSLKEMRYYSNLKLLKSVAGHPGVGRHVVDFQVHPCVDLQPAFEHPKEGHVRAITYEPDFLVHYNDGSREYVDCKGFGNRMWKGKVFDTRTEAYRIKRKMFLFKYRDAVITEV